MKYNNIHWRRAARTAKAYQRWPPHSTTNRPN